MPEEFKNRIVLEVVVGGPWDIKVVEGHIFSRSGEPWFVDHGEFQEMRIPFDNKDKAFRVAQRLDDHPAGLTGIFVYIDGEAYDPYEIRNEWADK